MKKASIFMSVAEGLIIFCCLIVTACKICKKLANDWFLAAIWFFSFLNLLDSIVLRLLMNINDIYTFDSFKEHPYMVFTAAARFILDALLFWVFSWGLFLSSIEFEE